MDIPSVNEALMGNLLVFSQPNLNLRSLYCLLRLGPKLNCMLECLADSTTVIIYYFACSLSIFLKKIRFCTEMYIMHELLGTIELKDKNIGKSLTNKQFKTRLLLKCFIKKQSNFLQNNPNKDYRIKFRRDWSSSFLPAHSLDSCKSPSNGKFSTPPFLFQLLNQSNSPDVFFDEVVGADFTTDMKLLQVAC